MEFNPINTQEEFDAAIKDRIQRERETVAKKYADYEELKTRSAAYEKQVGELNTSLDDLTKRSTDFEKEVADLTGKLAAHETASLKARIAYEMGIPYELSGRLSGTDEASIREDAKSLSGFIAQKQSLPPLKSTENSVAEDKDAPIKALLKNSEGE